jgi:flagellum-specific peptidoglycan hydrolase FlgJ
MNHAKSPGAALGQNALSLLIISLFILSSCSARKKTMAASAPAASAATISNSEAAENNKRIQKANQAAIAAFVPYTTQQYIDRFKGIAIQEMNLYGIPASITLAQGLFESGTGNGELAKVANNHFGIKCTFEWKGKSYYRDDDNKNDCFRVYDHPEDSYRDHSEFLKRKRYAALFELDKNNYQAWAYGLKAAGYATNPNYPQLLINLIQKYNLDQYDRPEGEVQKIKREDRVLTQINQNIGKAAKDSLIQSAPTDKIYTVRQGDTLYNISKRFGLTVDDLKALNNMADNNIKIGQQMVIAK